MTRLTEALRETVVSIITLIAKPSSIIGFAGALPTTRFTVKTSGPIEVTFARSTFGITEVAETATVTVRWSEFYAAFTAACAFLTVPR
jgi:hypothetical protein